MAPLPKGYPKVIANARLPGNRGPACLIVQFLDASGQKKMIRIPKSALLNKGTLMTTLADADCQIVLEFEGKDKDNLQSHLKSARPERVIHCTPSTGWFGTQFVLPDNVIRRAGELTNVIYEPTDTDELANFTVSGILDDWQHHVALPARHSPVMILGICMALGAPLLQLLGIEGGAVHLEAASSNGKSLTARVARSVAGPPKLLSWSTTVNGLERVAVAFNDALMCIDETGALDGNEKAQADLIHKTAFKIADGTGKLRGKGWEANAAWKVFLLSTGEVSLEAMVKASGVKRLQGGEVRFPNIPCRFGDYGVFSSLPRGYDTSAQLAEAMGRACHNYHGSALRAYLDHLVTNRLSATAKARALIDSFYTFAAVAEHPGWERRFAEKFAVAAAAGILAIRWKVLPWTENEVLIAIRRCYRRARKSVPDAGELLRRGMIRMHKRVSNPAQVIDLRRMSTSARRKFRPKKGHGYLRFREELGLHLLVRKEYFVDWFENPQQAQLVISELQSKSRLKPDPRDPDLQTRQILLWPDRPKRRYYVIALTNADLNDRTTHDRTPGG